MKQKKQTSYHPKRRWGTTFIPLLSLTVLVGLISLALAGVWQLSDKVEYIPPDTLPWKQAARAEKLPESSSSKSGSSTTSSSTSGTSEPEPTAEPAPTTEPEGWIARVPEGEWMPSAYFDDVLFVGDSITEGIKLYDVMSNAEVLSFTGINLDNIFTKEVIKTAGEEKLTIIDAAKLEKHGKIYIMMGANSMLSDKETFVKGYARLADALAEIHPDALIYIQSILPVTATYATNRPDFSNQKIDDYNAALEQMATDKKIFYLDIAEAFKDESGALPDEASPKDGMHFSADWYRKWFDYLRSHAATLAPA